MRTATRQYLASRSRRPPASGGPAAALEQALARARTLRPESPTWQQEAVLLAFFLDRAIRLAGKDPTQDVVEGVLRDADRVEALFDRVLASVRPDEGLRRWHAHVWRPLDAKARRLTAQTLRIGALMRVPSVEAGEGAHR
jgi:hypothetical protein